MDKEPRRAVVGATLCLGIICLSLFLPGAAGSQTIGAYFSPAGGLAFKTEPAAADIPPPLTIDQAFFNWLDRIPAGGEVKLAIYSFSSETLLDAILAAARRGVRVKLLLDGADRWKAGQIETITGRFNEELRRNPQPDLHLAVISNDSMHANNRFFLIPNDTGGKLITGSMHQKFGVSSATVGIQPVNAFFGSANFTGSSNDSYYENRIFFYDTPTVTSRFNAEFVRLWNRYGIPRAGSCPPEEQTPELAPADDDPNIVFNSHRTYGNRPDELAPAAAYKSPTERLILEYINRACKQAGTVNAALFSFTRKSLADALLQCAADHPTARIRILLDQHQAGLKEGDKDWRYLMGPYLEHETRRRRLTNIQVRYVWRSNAFSLREGKQFVALDYRRFPKMHHKFALINNRFLLTGSYNWTESAAFRNLENISVFDVRIAAQSKVVRGFINEFSAMWERAGIRTIAGHSARALCRLIRKALADTGCRKMRQRVETQPGGCQLTGLSSRRAPLKEAEIESLVSLIMADLVKLESGPAGLTAILRD